MEKTYQDNPLNGLSNIEDNYAILGDCQQQLTGSIKAAANALKSPQDQEVGPIYPSKKQLRNESGRVQPARHLTEQLLAKH